MFYVCLSFYNDLQDLKLLSFDQNASRDILQIVSNLPDFLRKPIILKKLHEFHSLSERDKYETISLILRGTCSVESTKLYPLIKTWLHILAELESVKVTEIFRIYCEFFLSNPTFFEKLNIQPLIDVFLKLENRNKEKLSDCLKEVFFLFPNRNEILKSIPGSTLQKLEIL
ncbi:MAG: hypothetical protein K0S67_854 [Nitrososphaeraceae archaeon]|jgi:hypothetical protein|nr:hypothetical protein [Nitrososphaeraceae archaeon]MCD6036966.1 hypothetical protein [Nitrososphaeraceae archaeon]MDF2767369.1 hypothetical protein [Nitrososphaeraceae archaeon]